MKVGQDLVLPSTVGVYFKGDTGYERKGTDGGLVLYQLMRFLMKAALRWKEKSSAMIDSSADRPYQKDRRKPL